MRPPNTLARDRLQAALRRGSLSAPAAAQLAGVSARSVLRVLAELGDRLITGGAAGRRRYALARALRGDARPIPVFAIDRNGAAHEAGALRFMEPTGSWFDLGALGWPIDASARDGWWEGLPYPLYDMRPQGFLGRAFARAEHRALEVSADPREWSDDDIVYVLSRRGDDVTGNLVLGEPSLRALQARRTQAEEPIKEAALASAYAELADRTVAQGVAGSSAAGEFPKFTAMRALRGSATPHVIVKFSGRDTGEASRRWSDLAVCEHLALECLRTVRGVGVARSRVLQAQGRTFLESERFDRHGRFGRAPLVSLEAINGHLLGLASNDWREHAAALLRRKLISAGDADAIARIWWFGRLIANSDMHLGNLSFVPDQGGLQLAPIYDMLPMAYAPLPGGEVPPARWTCDLPLPAESSQWRQACSAALAFWNAAASDARVSTRFRSACRQNASDLERCASHL